MNKTISLLAGIGVLALSSYGAAFQPPLSGAGGVGVSGNASNITIQAGSNITVQTNGNGNWTINGSTAPFNTSVSNSFNGTFTGNGAGLTNADGSTVGNSFLPFAASPLDFPTTGRQFAQSVDYATIISSSRPITNFNVTGAGVITKIRFDVEGLGTSTNLNDFMFNITVDGGPVQSVPWTYLVGVYLNQSGSLVATNQGSTDYFDIKHLKIDASGGTIMDVELFWPVPFTNGATIYSTALVNSGSSYSTVTYQTNLPECELRHLRFSLCSTNSFLPGPANGPGTVSVSSTTPYQITGIGTSFNATNVGSYIIIGGVDDHEALECRITNVANATSMQVAFDSAPNSPIFNSSSGLNYFIPRTNFTFLLRPIGEAGYIVSATGSGTNWNVPANTRLFIDQSDSPDLWWPDTEGFWGVEDGFTVPHGYLMPHDGMISLFYDGAGTQFWGCYRHWKQRPVRYTNGIRGLLNNIGSDFSGGTFNAYLCYTFIFYKSVP